MRPMLARVAPILGVPRVRQAAEYYRDVFGFELDPTAGVFQPDPGQPDGVYGIVNLGNASIHFQYRASFTAPSRDPIAIDREARRASLAGSCSDPL